MFSCRAICQAARQQSIQTVRGYARGHTGFQAANAGRSTFGVGMGARKTIKERMFGPTTGKAYRMGELALAGSAAFGVGALCFYGAGMSSKTGALEQSVFWHQYVKDRIHATYAHLGGSLALTAGAAALGARSPLVMRMMGGSSIMSFVAAVAAVVGSGMLVRSLEYGNPMKYGAWALHCGVMGVVLAPMCLMGGPMLVRAAAYTAGVVGGLSCIAVCAPSDKFLTMGGPLAMGLGVVFVSNIGTMFLPVGSALGAGLASIVVYGGLILFSGFLLYDTHRVIKVAQVTPYYGKEQDIYDPINAQMGIYMDILNIFIRIAMIMSGQRRK